MRTPLLALALLASLAAVPAAASASARCAPLLTDPAGDVAETGANPPYPVEDVRQVDLLSADIATTRTTITARIRLAALGLESSPSESHAYEVGFTTGEQRYYLVAHHDSAEDSYELSHLLTGPAAPEDKGLIAPGAAEVLATVKGTYDARHDTITVTAPLSAFKRTGGVGASLTAIRASTYAGTRPPGGAVYEWADQGRTDRYYRVGARGCG
jgi:hypothetical protein